MGLDQLVALLAVAVAEARTCSRAAILPATAQPVLSRKVKLLSDELFLNGLSMDPGCIVDPTITRLLVCGAPFASGFSAQAATG